MGARRWKERGAIVENAAVEGCGGESITAIDNDVPLLRPRGLTNPEMEAAIKTKDRRKLTERLILARLLLA